MEIRIRRFRTNKILKREREGERESKTVKLVIIFKEKYFSDVTLNVSVLKS